MPRARLSGYAALARLSLRAVLDSSALSFSSRWRVRRSNGSRTAHGSDVDSSARDKVASMKNPFCYHKEGERVAIKAINMHADEQQSDSVL